MGTKLDLHPISLLQFAIIVALDVSKVTMLANSQCPYPIVAVPAYKTAASLLQPHPTRFVECQSDRSGKSRDYSVARSYR